VKLKKKPKPSRPGKKTQKNPKKTQKTQKKPLGWVFLKKTRVFSNPAPSARRWRSVSKLTMQVLARHLFRSIQVLGDGGVSITQQKILYQQKTSKYPKKSMKDVSKSYLFFAG
jgi:hypothetical protein